MARKRRIRPKKHRFLPPWFDPAKHVWVNSKEGGYPRRKRGTVKPASLNANLQTGIGLRAGDAVPAKKPYIIFLKVSCLTGGGPAFDSSSHGMQVIETG